ncbi:FAD binding domain-containing protein [Gigaspora rosea]|uniref:FAD binding domain-containing protein n=1 Tax=Gigaspora rosea TaxID=44941 RepID=A0A397UV20_9GLOM|nr:FAD binding domain-containing protein [Gigaspora rosea]
MSWYSFFGGNSTNATSGINGALTKTQIALGVQDSAEIFAQDTARSARDLARPDLIKVLIGNSASAVVWLQEGHSQPRTHRGKEMFPEYGPVILSTRGYAADFIEDSLLKKYRPDIYNLPTTNGKHSTGDGHKMVITIGERLLISDMEKVKSSNWIGYPKEPDAKIKFLAAEALRGVGGLLLNSEGKRFCAELGYRDYVTGEIWKTKGSVRLALNSKLQKKLNSIVNIIFGERNWYFCITTKGNKDTFGKKFFHNFPITINDQFHVALMYPVLHYTMDGIDINVESEVRDMQELGGSSLLGCVVNGRVAGDSASRYLFQNLSSATANCQVAMHNKKMLDCWVIANGEVLNTTNFLPAIIIYAATEEFNMLHDKGVV